MGTGTLMGIGLQALLANQAALSTVSQNIANVNTPGYSRQTAVLTTPAGQYTGAGYLGQGVSVQTVTRSYSSFLTTQAATTSSQSSMDATALTQLQSLQNVFPTSGDNIGSAGDSLLNAMVGVSNSPSDPSPRQVVLGDAQDLVSQYQNAAQQLADMQSGVNSDLTVDAKTVNGLAAQIATLNGQIAAGSAAGQPPNDLLDQRDELVSQLSQYVQVSTVPASDGSEGVFIGGGQNLVLGTNAQSLSISPDNYDSARSQLSISNVDGSRPLDPSVMTGGSMTALLNFQNNDLQDARNNVGQMAVALTSQVNQQQSLGLDLSNPATSGPPIFSYSQPTALPSSSNTRNSDGKLAASMSVQITDATKLPAQSFVVSNPTGAADQYVLTTRPGGVSQTLTGEQIQQQYGFSLTVNGTMASTDSFLVEPVAQVTGTIKQALTDPDGIAAASPITATAAVANTGTATVQSLYAVNSNFNAAEQPITIQFGSTNADNSVNYTMTLADGSTLNDTWTPGGTIGNDPANGVNLGFELSLTGVPASGDTISTQTTADPATNNGNIQAFTNLGTSGIVGRTVLANGSVQQGATPANAYAAAMAQVGTQVQSAKYLATTSASVASDAATAMTNNSGVNLDEEATRLMQYQQGYQASAQVLQTAETVFNQILQLGSSSG